MSYVRVIPRDLFNEADLLKCLGRLYIALENLHRHRAELSDGNGEAFRIIQDEADGSIAVANLPFSIGGRGYWLSRPLNARTPWPLYATDQDTDDEVRVFTELGELSPEFLALIAMPAEPEASGTVYDMETIYDYLNDREARPYERLRRVDVDPLPEVEVTAEVFEHFLNILPPGYAPGVSFFVIERITGETVSAYRKEGGRYFHRYMIPAPRDRV